MRSSFDSLPLFVVIVALLGVGVVRARAARLEAASAAQTLAGVQAR
jgi:hypothetical protein